MSLVRDPASTASAIAPASLLAGATGNRPWFSHLLARGERKEGHCVQRQQRHSACLCGPTCSSVLEAGAELSTARGSAKAADHNGIVHDIWTYAFAHKVQLWLVRVPSEENISDSPSRGDHRLLSELGAQWRRPVWDLSL